MDTVQDIEAAITRLTRTEQARLEQWFYSHVFPRHEGELADGVSEAAASYSAARTPRRLISYEEYLHLEQNSPVRHEYVAGLLFAMSGASRNHNRISGNLFNAFSAHLRHGPCEVFIASFNVRVEKQDCGYYPDVMVACDRERRDQYYSQEPRLIVEVLSPSTRNKDQREKFLSYRTLLTLEEYVLVEQDSPEVLIYRRDTPRDLQEIHGLEHTVEFKSIGLSMPMTQIFADVL